MSERVPTQEMGLVQLLSLALSILILVAIGAENLLPLRPSAAELIDDIDYFVCFFFLMDFFHRWYVAPSKLQFLKWGWIDFISSLPTVGILQVARIARIFRILRVLRVFRSSQALWKYASHSRPKATLKGAFLLAVVTFLISSVVILECESTSDANIKTPSDAVWWAFSTMITVGCEKYPVTSLGHAVGATLSIVGVGLMAVYTAYVASIFLSGSSDTKVIADLVHEVRALRLQMSVDKIRTYDEVAHPPPLPRGETVADENHSTTSTGHLGSTARNALP